MECRMRVDEVEQLNAGQLSEVLALFEAASRLDKVAPLSEQALLAARTGHPVDATTSTPHFLAYVGRHLAGYAHLEAGPDGAGSDGVPATAEVVVGPAHRRQGVGTALVNALEAALASATPNETATRPNAVMLQIWAHGHLDGARALAVRDGFSIVRELWQMRRSLRPDTHSPPSAGPLPAVSLPEGFSARPFVVGQDEDDWLRVNARAFVDHPEQGRMTRQDLDQRIAEPWFDAAGLILIEDRQGHLPVLAASHWTKVVPATDPKVSQTEGEVYVVGVDPAYQGMGLGRAVTLLGLAHLREKGLAEAMLYVEAENVAALATYSRLGFARSGVDIMYSRTVH